MRTRSLSTSWCLLMAGLVAAAPTSAQTITRTALAWMGAPVPSASSNAAGFSEARINWPGSANDWTTTDAAPGEGLSHGGPAFWPHWEGRIGVMLDRPNDAMRNTDTTVPTSTSTPLQWRALHILSDYHFGQGFRATAGIVGGDSAQAWWSGSEGQGRGLNLSVQRVDTLTQGMSPRTDPAHDTTAYFGAGYTTKLKWQGRPSAWRFNADLGLLTINSNNLYRFTQVMQGDRPLSDLTRDLRFRHVIKFSLGYSF